MGDPLLPILKPYEPPHIQSRRASPGFIAQLLDALVGQPGDPELARVAGKWRSDPAAVPWITLGYVSAVPNGFRKAFQANLAIAIGGVAALGGIFQAALEKPERPGSISANNLLVRYIGEKELLALARALRPLVDQLDRDDVLTGSQRIADTLAGAIVLAAAEQRAKLLAAKTPFEFGQVLGDLAGQFSGEIAVNEALGMAERSASAAKITRELPEIAEHYKTVVNQNADKAVVQSLANNVKDAEQASESVPVLVEEGAAAPAKEPAAAPKEASPKEAPPKSKFQLGDVGAMTDEPIEPMVHTTVEKPGRPDMVKLVGEARKLQGAPAWASQLPDQTVGAFVEKAEALVASTEKLDAAQMKIRKGMMGGYMQEQLIPDHPRFRPLLEQLKKELAGDSRFDPEAIEFAIVRNREPATMQDVRGPDGKYKMNTAVQEQELADGVLVVRARDPNDRVQFMIVVDFESKSWTNIRDLFFETEEGARVAQRGQYARDLERFSNTDLLLDFVDANRNITTTHVPAGRTAISRQSTRYVMVTPRPVSPEWRSVLTNEIGIRSTHIEEWAPTFPRSEIDDWAESLLRWAFNKKKLLK